MRRYVLYRTIWMLVAWICLCAIDAKAQQAKPGAYPDFKASFDALIHNRVLYNQYNDSIFLIRDKDAWVSFFKRRAVKNHELFEDNRRLIKGIKDYFSQPSVPLEDYIKYEYALGDYVYSGKNDPFLTLDFCKILDRYYETVEVPDSMNYFNLLNTWKAINLVPVANLGKDSLSLRKAYYYLKQNLDPRYKNYSGYKRGYLYALLNLSKTLWLVDGLQGIQENRWANERLKAINDSMDVSTVVTKNEALVIKNSLANYEEMLLRNVYLVDSTAMDKHFADSLMMSVVKRNMANKNLDIMNYQRTLLMQNKLGQLSMDEALVKMMEKYEQSRKQMQKKRMTDLELNHFLRPCFTLLYINDMTSRSFSKKRKLVKILCRDIEMAYHHRADQQMKTLYVKLLIELSDYPRLIKYLTEKERVRFLNALNVATQVTTYAHSVHVAMIAEELMKGIIQYRPELLVGVLGHLQISDVLKNKQKYVDYIHDAAMYHDLGKNSIISVVHNDYRPLTDEEFAIIKSHPVLGEKYLAIAPNLLSKFHDTTLGHHKWYNGKGGYPDSFDNTQSPMRIMIDIVTLSDCMQAATERVGRNYKGDKTFDTVMEEFRRDAGTRYNPDLVDFIDQHENVARKLADLINEGWVDIYYDIYSQFMK